MPHKHKRKAGDAPDFDLPPTQRAAPLPVGKGRTAQQSARSKKRKVAHVEGYGQDDTPKAFARMMAFTQGRAASGAGAGAAGKKKRSGLDDGNAPTKKQRKAAAAAATAASESAALEPAQEKNTSTAAPKIQPGESMAEFSARVDAALPLSGITRTTKKSALGGPDHRVTKHEKRLKRLQAGWREEEARIRDKEDEARELAEEDEDEQAALWAAEGDAGEPSMRANGKRAKKKGRKKVVGEVDADDEFEAELKRRREEKRQRGIHDVVDAPPTFARVPREIFKVKNGARVNVDNVPSAAGSLRKREELGEERRTIIDTYRELMAKKKGGAN